MREGSKKGGQPVDEKGEKRKIRILWVDDETDFLELVCFWLRSEGYEVTTLTSGEEAVRRIREGSPDIVFLDIHMPGMDGLETLTRIRKLRKELPVIMVTAYPEEERSFSTAIKLQVSGFFPKQISLPKLKTSIETILATHVKLASS